MLVTERNKETTEEMLRQGIVMLDFWAPWCGVCKMMEPIVEEMAAETDACVIRINADEEPALAERYQVMSLPAFVVLKDGRETAGATGAKTKQALLELLRR